MGREERRVRPWKGVMMRREMTGEVIGTGTGTGAGTGLIEYKTCG